MARLRFYNMVSASASLSTSSLFRLTINDFHLFCVAARTHTHTEDQSMDVILFEISVNEILKKKNSFSGQLTLNYKISS